MFGGILLVVVFVQVRRLRFISGFFCVWRGEKFQDIFFRVLLVIAGSWGVVGGFVDKELDGLGFLGFRGGGRGEVVQSGGFWVSFRLGRRGSRLLWERVFFLKKGIRCLIVGYKINIQLVFSFNFLKVVFFCFF